MTTLLEKELDANHASFLQDWTTQAQANWGKLSGHKHFSASYRRLSCLNGIQHALILPQFGNDSAAFFLEAQNDALVSHVSANVGSWRAALQSLRSCVENVLCSIFYNEHPVELELWAKGDFRIGFADLHRYMVKHPRLSSYGSAITGLDTIKGEYELLSKAVHASAKSFRMTEGAAKVLLWSIEEAKLGAWSTREKRVLEAICSLSACYFALQLQGNKQAGLRSVMFFAIGKARRDQLKQRVGIAISPP